MPKVGAREFSYDAEGLKAAEAYAAESGQQVEQKRRYQVGGLVHRSGPKRKRMKVRGGGAATRGLDFYKG